MRFNYFALVNQLWPQNHQLYILCAAVASSFVIISISFVYGPLDVFEDDAFWLIPSLVSDLNSGKTWADQIVRDIGERGAESLNMYLRMEYLLFGNQPYAFFVVGLLLHIICSLLFLLCLSSSGYLSVHCSVLSYLFFICSTGFHCYFWSIANQHILAMISLLSTFSLTKILMTSNLPFRRNLVFCGIIFLMSFNRTVVIVNFLTICINYLESIKLQKFSIQLLFGRFISCCVLALAYPMYSLLIGAEGWQINSFLEFDNNLNIIILLAGFTLLTVAFYYKVSSFKYFKYMTKDNVYLLLKMLPIIAILISVLVFDKRVVVLPTVIENFFYPVGISHNISERWAPLYIYDNQILSLIIFIIFIIVSTASVCKSDSNDNPFLSVLLVLIAVSISYIGHMSFKSAYFISVPSRYSYYFIPGILLSGLICYNNASRILISNIYTRKIISVCFIILFTLSNMYSLGVRVRHNKMAALFSTFPVFSSKLLAVVIEDWAAKNNIHDQEILITTNSKTISENYSTAEWPESLKDFIPDYGTIYDPIIFGVQSYLNQSSSNIILRTTEIKSRLNWCNNWICEGERPLLKHGLCKDLNMNYSDLFYLYPWLYNTNIENSHTASEILKNNCL